MSSRSRTTLTELGVRRAKHDPAKPIELHDDVARGLVLLISKGGTKAWYFVKSHGGNRFRINIGKYPAVSLADARGAVNAYAGKLASGELSKKRPRKAKVAGIVTVEDLKKAFIDDYKLGHKSWRNVEQDLDNHVIPILGKRRPDKVRRNDIGDVLLELEEMPRVHNKVKSHLSGMFKWAARPSRGIVTANPVVGFETLSTQSRERVLADDELRAIWKACDGIGYPYGPFFQLLMLLGQRRTETAAMERALLGHNSGLWEIPAERTKNGRPHLVPLPKLALDIIADLPVFLDADGKRVQFVIPAPTKTDSYLTTFSDGKELVDEKSGVTGWWLHDLRRTMSTGMAGLGIQPVVIEAVLNHASGQQSRVAGTYNRYSYLDEKRAALEAWADHIMRICKAN